MRNNITKVMLQSHDLVDNCILFLENTEVAIYEIVQFPAHAKMSLSPTSMINCRCLLFFLSFLFHSSSVVLVLLQKPISSGKKVTPNQVGVLI